MNYINSFNNYVKFSSINIIEKIGDFSIVTGAEKNEVTELFDTNLLVPNFNNVNLDYLGLSFKLDTEELIGSTKGEYELIIIFFQNENNIDKILHTIIVSSKEIYGSPYGLTDSFTWNYLFPYPTNLSNWNGKLQIGLIEKDFKETGQVITLKECELSVGFLKNKISENSLQLEINKN